MYGITMPADIRSILLTLRIGISLGIDGIPLACVGAPAMGLNSAVCCWLLSLRVAIPALSAATWRRPHSCVRDVH